MKEDCIFCGIVSGKIPSYTLYEDEQIKVFLDLYPVSEGHCLYVSKKHYEFLEEVPEEEMNFLNKLPKILNIVKSTVNASGINIIQNNGRDAGQIVPHVHFHIIPRFENDGKIKFPRSETLQKEKAEEIITKVSKYKIE